MADAPADFDPEYWRLRLYVAGQTPKSLIALANLKAICERHLAGRYEIELVDLVRSPQAVNEDSVIALPTVVRRLPEPLRSVIGDLSDTERVLVGLDILPTP